MHHLHSESKPSSSVELAQSDGIVDFPLSRAVQALIQPGLHSNRFNDIGRCDLSAECRDTKSLRCCGPERATAFGLPTHVDVTGARNK
jgi:hypothetical protein